MALVIIEDGALPLPRCDEATLLAALVEIDAARGSF